MSATLGSLSQRDVSDLKAVAKRRSHRKSRLGCNECKRRKIKCDEAKPACEHCAAHSVACVYPLGRPPRESLPVTIRSTDSAVLTPSTSNSTDSGPAPNVARSSAATGTSSSPTSTLMSMPMYYLDLELMHHYNASAAEAYGGGPFWSVELPKISFRNHAVLHLVLGLSALHLGHCESSRQKSLAHAADRHYSTALPRVTSQLSCLDETNASVLYAAAVLICLFTFARGPQDGQYIMFSDAGTPDWLPLLRGVRVIRTGFSHVLPPENIPRNMNCVMNPSPLPLALVPSYAEPFAKLKSLIECMSLEDASFDKYREPLEALRDCFVAQYEGPEQAENLYSQATFSWLYSLPDDFSEALQAKKPFALVMFAFYMVLLKQLETQWLYRNWAKHVMTGIYRHLPSNLHDHIDWAADCIGI